MFHKLIILKQLLLRRLVMAVVLLLLGSDGAVLGQTAVGEWQLHVPYRQGKAVEEAGDRIYTVVEQGLFYYDKTFNATETLTKNDGLREQDISAIGYDETTKTLVIAYANTYLDLLQEDEITSISDIFRRNIPGEKKINSIFIHNKLAYMATSFGIVVLDLVKQEIKATYGNLGPNGEQLNIRSVTVLGDSIYVATNAGVLAASMNGPNLQDYRNWRLKAQGLPTLNQQAHLTAFNGNIYVSTATNGIYRFANDQWQTTGIANGSAVLSIRASNDYLVATLPGRLILLDKQGNTSEIAQALITAPKDALIGSDKAIWVADGVKGLVKLGINGANAVAFAPEGPYAGTGFSLYANNGKVYVFGGSYTGNYTSGNSTAGFYTYENGNWESYNRQTVPDFPPAEDLVSGVVQPASGNLYIASYGDGLLEWNGESFTIYNAANSPLLPTENTSEVRITDVAVDDAGKIWMVNRNQKQNAPGLFSLSPDKTWQSYSLPIADGANLEHLLIDDSGYKWLSVSRQGNSSNGLVVFDETEKKTRQLTTGQGFGNLPDGNIYALTKDLNGDIWVGTGKGVGVFYNPGAVFDTELYDVHIPIINRRPLLDGQVVRAIAVDGANRKWIGTDNGLWLFGPDGDELVQHFTTENSPLPSNKIVSVAVEHKTGNVFVATEAGIASYRGGATITEGEPACAVVFPNPVQRSYTGLVAISELPNNAEVHITDIAGKLIYKTRATGGTVTWNVRDYNGNRAKAGVYLVMSSDADGKQTCISKIAVLQ